MSIILKAVKGNVLFFSFLLPLLTDEVLTLLGQDPFYWQSYHSANEISPAYFFLATHPILYILGAILWLLASYWIVKWLKYPLNMMFAIACIAGHGWGSTSWLERMLGNANLLSIANRPLIVFSWALLVLYFVLIGVCAGLSFFAYIRDHQKKEASTA